MNYENINYNEVLLSGKINGINDDGNMYIKFGLTSKKYTPTEKKDVYVGLNIERRLYNIYKDYFFKGNKVFVKGYINSYIGADKKIQVFISVTDIADNPNDITQGRSAPHIRYDPDGMMVWNGKRCESEIATKEEQKEIMELLKDYR